MESVKNRIIIFIVLIIVFSNMFISCSGNEPDNTRSYLEIYLLQDTTIKYLDIYNQDYSTLKFKESPWLTDKDIDFYDYSSHCIYLKTDKSVFFPQYKFFYFTPSWQGRPFFVFSEGKICYAGLFGYWEAHTFFYSYYAPFIGVYEAATTPNHILLVSFWNCLIKDVRDNDLLKNALIKSNKYHAGIDIDIDSVKIYNSDTTTVEFILNITNNDIDNLYIIDPDKFNMGYFNYYNSGLEFITSQKSMIWATKDFVLKPQPYNSFDISWFTLVKSGNTMSRKVLLKGYDNIPYGDYYCVIDFAGPHLDFDENKIRLNDGRVWIGPKHSNTISITFDKDNNCKINNKHVVLNN